MRGSIPRSSIHQIGFSFFLSFLSIQFICIYPEALCFTCTLQMVACNVSDTVRWPAARNRHGGSFILRFIYSRFRPLNRRCRLKHSPAKCAVLSREISQVCNSAWSKQPLFLYKCSSGLSTIFIHPISRPIRKNSTIMTTTMTMVLMGAFSAGS